MVILSHLDFAAVAAHLHYLLGWQLEVLESCLNERLSSPHVINSVTLNAYQFAKVSHRSLSYTHTYIRFPVLLGSMYITLNELFLRVLQVLGNVHEVPVPAELVAFHWVFGVSFPVDFHYNRDTVTVVA